jgi:hypothetical protein
MSGLNWFHSICTLPVFTYLCWRKYLESGDVRFELDPFYLYTIYLPMLETRTWSPVMFGLNGSFLFVHYLPTYAEDTYLESGHVRYELVPFYLYTIYLPMLENQGRT